VSTALQHEHAHITRRPDVCGGEPIIDGLRVTVRHVVTLYHAGENVAEIAESLNLTEAQVFHGLSYYFDHRDEIDTIDTVVGAEERSAATSTSDSNGTWWQYLQIARAQVDAAGRAHRSATEIESDRLAFREERSGSDHGSAMASGSSAEVCGQ
jgi:uncharacterized protein (DUF433 family)